MKSPIRLLILCLLSLSAWACTNNGHIGYLYGVWLIDSYTIDGIEADVDLANYSWRFQSDIIQITEQFGDHEYLESTGTWSFSDDERYLLLNFTNTRPGVPEDSPSYNPPAALGIPGRAITEMKILTQTSTRLSLSFTNSEGQLQRYDLRKSR
ncbi:MAG: lipocalin-like domain-containing protein [Bacteroidales bacterium]|nr:lipocalin-like domain-containing protein [Bacteroidales bacterium]